MKLKPCFNIKRRAVYDVYRPCRLNYGSCYCAFSFGPFVRSRLSSSTSSQSPSQEGSSKGEAGTGSQSFLSKTSQIAPARRQNANKKRAWGDSNESLWTLNFYSETYLNAAPQGTKLGAELGQFWVGQRQRESE